MDHLAPLPPLPPASIVLLDRAVQPIAPLYAWLGHSLPPNPLSAILVVAAATPMTALLRVEIALLEATVMEGCSTPARRARGHSLKH